MNGAKITIRLPKELYKQAKAKAKREDITISQVLRRCLREWIADDASKQKG
jgi:hypothetical protein